MNEWFWPQYTYVVLVVLNTFAAIWRAGGKKDAPEAVAYLSVHSALTALVLFILYKGGFF